MASSMDSNVRPMPSTVTVTLSWSPIVAVQTGLLNASAVIISPYEIFGGSFSDVIPRNDPGSPGLIAGTVPPRSRRYVTDFVRQPKNFRELLNAEPRWQRLEKAVKSL